MAITATLLKPRSIWRTLSVLLACAGVAGYGLWLASGVLVKDGNWVGVDFHVYYTAARVLGRGGDIYTAGISPPYVYPPLLAVLVLPLSALPVNAATIAWKLLQHLCLLSAGVLLVSLLPRGVRLLATGVLLFGWLLVPVHDEILLGESNSLVLLLVAGAIWATARAIGREAGATATGLDPKVAVRNGGESQASGEGDTLMAVAGTLLGVAAGIKVLPLLLIAYFWWRGPRLVAALSTAGFIALQLATLAATPSTARYWFVEFPSLFGQAFPFLDNQSFNAAISRAFLPADPSLPGTLWVMQILQGDFLLSLLTGLANLSAMAALFLVLRSAPRPASASDRDAYRTGLLLEVGLVLLTMHLVSGSTWMHHLVDLCVPVCGLLGAWWLRGSYKEHSSRPTTATFGALGAAFVLVFRRPADWLSLFGGSAASNPLVAWLISNSALWALLLVWIAVAAALLSSRKSIRPLDA